YPTVIKDFQARRAEGRDRAMIVSTMQRLCGQLNTPVTWNEQVGRLEVQIS
ncbi:MAG: CapA family protein, partial [Ktedonobacteraceae bacterium]|nr:CapA family protein [Ktedonobacteraceae bacterium]